MAELLEHFPNIQLCSNPELHNGHTTVASAGVSSLQSLCVRRVRQLVTISRFKQLYDLPLPANLMRHIGYLCLVDLHINMADIGPENIDEKFFPATCTFDDSKVFLQVIESGDSSLVDDPSAYATFKSNNVHCSVYPYIPTLREIIRKSKEADTPLEEYFIWKVLAQLSTLASSFDPSNQLTTANIHVLGQDIFFRAKAEDHTKTNIVNSTWVSVYEAPEVLMKQLPSRQSLSWCIGCIGYEMVMLDPAFYDRSRTGNVLNIMMGIVQGQKPPPLSEGVYSLDLLRLIEDCLEHNPASRVTVQSIGAKAEEFLSSR